MSTDLARSGDLAALVHLYRCRTDTILRPYGVLAAGGDGRPWEVLEEVDLGDLFGYRAPTEIDAVAIVATGQARFLGPASDTTGSTTADPVDLVVALDRHGRQAASVLRADGTDLGMPEGGRLADTMRRVLDLPTAPAEVDPRMLLSALWLAEIGATYRRRPMSWPDALTHHPANWSRGEGYRAPMRELEANRLVVDSGVSWGLIRSLAAAGAGGLGDLCPPDLAAWMDEGMFSRWVVGEMGDPAALLARALLRLSASARSRLLAVLRRSGPWGAELAGARRAKVEDR